MKNHFYLYISCMMVLISYSTGAKSSDTEFKLIPVNFSLLPGVSIGNLYNDGLKLQNCANLGFISNSDKLSGVDLSLIYSGYTQSSDGVQLSFLANYTVGNFNGVQATGIANYLSGSLNGIQLSSGFNYARNGINGIQASYGANLADHLNGMQCGLLFNSCDNLQGLQLAFGLNNADSVTPGGVQLSAINISDINNGYPIGLISVSNNYGVHADLLTDENGYVMIALRTGSPHFHNQIFWGRRFSNKLNYTLGWGFGYRLNFNPDLYGDFMFSFQELYDQSDYSMLSFENKLLKLKLNVGYKVADFCSLYAGPTLNYYASDVVSGTWLNGLMLDSWSAGGQNRKLFLGFDAGINF